MVCSSCFKGDDYGQFARELDRRTICAQCNDFVFADRSGNFVGGLVLLNSRAFHRCSGVEPDDCRCALTGSSKTKWTFGRTAEMVGHFDCVDGAVNSRDADVGACIDGRSLTNGRAKRPRRINFHRPT